MAYTGLIEREKPLLSLHPYHKDTSLYNSDETFIHPYK